MAEQGSGFSFRSGTTTPGSPWPAGVPWRCVDFDLRAVYLTALDVRKPRSKPENSVSRYLFTEVLEPWVPHGAPGRATHDLLALTNGTFLYQSLGPFGDLVGHRPDHGSLLERETLPGVPQGDTMPNLACRWYVATEADGAGVPTWRLGTGRWTAPCEATTPPTPPPGAGLTFLLGGGVLLHDPSRRLPDAGPSDPGFDGSRLPRSAYEEQFNHWNEGFFRGPDGSCKRQPPFPRGDCQSHSKPNSLSVEREVARWSFAITGPHHGRLLSVSSGNRPTGGMGVLHLLRFGLSLTPPARAMVMFDGSKPHCFASTEDSDLVTGRPARVHALPGGTTEHPEDPNTYCALFRRAGCSLLEIGDGDLATPTTTRANVPAPPLPVTFPAEPEDGIPDPGVPVAFEVRLHGDSHPTQVTIAASSGWSYTWGRTEVQPDDRGVWTSSTRWPRQHDDPPQDELSLTVRTDAPEAIVLAEHRVALEWSRQPGRIPFFVKGDLGGAPLDQITLTLRNLRSGERATALTQSGHATCLVPAGWAEVEFTDALDRVEPESRRIWIPPIPEGRTEHVTLRERRWTTTVPVVDATSGEPVTDAVADVAIEYGTPFRVAAPPSGILTCGLPFAEARVTVSSASGSYRSHLLTLPEANFDRTLDPVELLRNPDPGPSRIRGRVWIRYPGSAPAPWKGPLRIQKLFLQPDGTPRREEVASGESVPSGHFDIEIPGSSGRHTMHFLRGDTYEWDPIPFDAPRFVITERDFVIVPDVVIP